MNNLWVYQMFGCLNELRSQCLLISYMLHKNHNVGYILMIFPGSSWAAVLEKRNGLSFPADLYLEGTDQHRGWFQSSLLTCVATKGKECILSFCMIHYTCSHKLHNLLSSFYICFPVAPYE